ncbi:MAG: cytochrome b N-terminal domain-containing protein [Candidatus Bathyarchaeota archaeon]|nr:cytochrome b N-terminal domain-containing protein [Candidatus Bathyarchaeota archaeon]MDP7443044.1 cytochrome b N-terminal domain-containing protein [Candidatus Bathyarchaeota archaeon]
MNKTEFLVEKLKEIFRWIEDRYKATVLSSVRLNFPLTFSSILSNLGMATFISFMIACGTGLFLLLYYTPTPWNLAYDSIKFITEEVIFGHLIRGLHYHGSNAMVLFSIIHIIYVFFKRMYKGRFDFLWITGVLLGVITVMVAFTGYTLIFNELAVEAQNIMMGIAEAVHPLAKLLMAGTNLTDRSLRLYAFHIGLIPAMMLALMGLHFPRALKISIPMIIGILAVIFLATAVYPAEVGIKFDPSISTEFKPPEWYLLWVLTLLRTWAPVIIVGVLIPGALVMVTMGVPWIDRGRKPKLTDRPAFAVMGMTSIIYWIYLTLRAGYGVGPPALQIPVHEVVGVFLLFLGGSAFIFRLLTPWLKSRPRAKRRPATGYLKGNLSLGILSLIVLIQAALLWVFSSAYIHSNTEMMAFSLGFVILGFGIAQHVYAVANPKT